MKKKKCLNCKKSFKGRPNKKFCSDSCKNAYHNKNQKNYYQIAKNAQKEITQLKERIAELEEQNKKIVESQTEINIDTIILENKILRKYKKAIDEYQNNIKNFKIDAQSVFVQKVEHIDEEISKLNS